MPQTSDAPERQRFGDPWKFIPVVFVCVTIGILYSVYVFNHCISLLQLSVDENRLDDDMRQRGIIELIVFNYFTLLLLIAYVRSILVNPGEVDPKFRFSSDGIAPQVDIGSLYLQETKKTGERRWCKWCNHYKPDRCHHCRVCRTCVLKMDHHCPWIYNCVGFFNYKYFFLVLVYSALCCHMIVLTMLESLMRAVDQDAPFSEMFFLFFGETLAFFLGALVTAFLCFHIYLASRAMSTIEYCEKQLPGKEGLYSTSIYDRGPLENFKAILGPTVWLWPFPVSPPEGNGMEFDTNSRLTKSIESGRGPRKKSHQRTQRAQRSARPMASDYMGESSPEHNV